MRIVVSGTHASGKSTLISDFHAVHPEYRTLGDPFEDLDLEEPAGEAGFAAQLRISTVRLQESSADDDVIAERGPLDFLAYLIALERLGRSDGALLARASRIVEESAESIDLIVVVPLDGERPIHVPDDEDPELREAMDQALQEIADDLEHDDVVRVITVGGDAASRLRAVLAAVAG
ncbi:AAA family ATPase [Microbacterium sp. NPDC055665]